jgi:alginate O-acetyltransferase complex protein AlgI
MLFNSYLFIFLFLPLTLVGSHVLARRHPGRPVLAWLVLASLIFYGWWSPPLVLMLLASITFNYAIGAVLSQRDAVPPARRKLLLWSGIGGNLVLLGQCKYANFFIAITNDLTGAAIPPGPLLLPLAISFFTFQQIAYLVDVHRGATHSADPLRYGLFVTFFPQLIAGPIVHHREMLPQFAERGIGRLRAANLAVGSTIFLIGLVKKVVVADGIAALANPVFDAALAADGAPGFADAWGGALAYTFQLYFDFSGYSDMAIGLAAMFGLRIPINFNSPYKAASIVDFWRRWHVTLSRFLRDYLYIPLGGNRHGRVRRHVNLLLTMLLGGLWHGAGWTFVLWGAAHGLLLVLNHGWRALRRRIGPAAPLGGLPGRLAAVALTFTCVVGTWVLFRAETLPAAGRMLRAMSGVDGFAGPALAHATDAGAGTVFGPEQLLVFIALLAVVWCLPNTQELMGEHLPGTAEADLSAGRAGRGFRRPVLAPAWTPSLRWAAYAAALGMVSLLGMVERSEFVYFRF